MNSIATTWMWIGFSIFIFIMLFLDLFLLHGKRAHRVSLRESLSWTIVWISLALLFNLLLYWYLDQTQGSVIAYQKSLEFLTGYLIEESLSIDNLFVFAMIFSYFSVPPIYQKRVLFYGLLGAILMRLCFILLGIWLITKFHWILYIFGLFLLYTGLKMLLHKKQTADLSQNPMLIWLKKHLRITHEYHAENFFIKLNGLLYATPLFIVLVFIEISDIIFALDSIPAIFAITQDPFIVFTSNIFAILGLRSLYFVLANMIQKFQLLRYGLALILVFIGIKMLIAPWVQIPITITLGVVASILIFFSLLSVYKNEDNA